MRLRDQQDAFACADALLVGGRVRLRGLRDADLPVLAGWLMDPAIKVTQSTTATPPSEAAARAELASWAAGHPDRP